MLLDVAAGTGHATRALASRVLVAIAVDVTEEMLAAGKASARREGLSNVIFQRGDALALPFLEESFDVVILRFATHHIERPDVQLAEMARCLRAGGRLALADVLADDDPEIARRQNDLEQVRDSSHTRTLSVRELIAMMEGLGLEQIEVQARPVVHRAESWLQRAGSPSAATAARARLQADLEGGAATGLQPFESDAELWLTQVWGCVRAVKPLD
jgi:SAM-dependent methyltransferase